MESIPFLLVALFIFYKLNAIYWRKSRRRFIQNYTFKPMIKKRVLKTYPYLSDSDLDLVFKALRQYFELSLNTKNNLLAMPSQVVDVAWHEMILNTREYTRFCHNAFGKYLHHTPTEAMEKPQMAQESIKRVWRVCCEREGINPLSPSALPLLFEIDKKLNIEDGFKYTLFCNGNSDEYCAAHIACSGGKNSVYKHKRGGDKRGTNCSGGCASGCSSGCGGGCGGG